MECRVYRPMDRDVVNVWFFEDVGNDRHVIVFEGAPDPDSHNFLYRREIVPHGSPMPVSLELHPEWLSALLKAGADFEPPSSAMANHLKDAVGVRDRMLGMLEKMVDEHVG